MTVKGKVHVAEVDNSGWVEIATIKGPATLNGIGVAKSDGRNHNVKLEYEGTELVEEVIVGSAAGTNENSCKIFNIKFEDELCVEVRDDPYTGNPKHRYWVTVSY